MSEIMDTILSINPGDSFDNLEAISPNDRVMICHGVPLDGFYRDTFWWTDVNSQVDYFLEKCKVVGGRQLFLTSLSPIDFNRGNVRVEIDSVDIEDCNYLVLQRRGSTIRYFAFLTNIERVNNTVSRLHFEIDVLQTYFFTWTLRTSLVERAHTETDEVGKYTYPEGLELGQYVIADSSSNFYDWGDMRIIVASPFDLSGNKVHGQMYSGIYSGIRLHDYEGSNAGADGVNEFLYNNAGKQDAILSIFMYPEKFISEPYSSEPVRHGFDIERPTKLADGYVPKCKKMLTYPFCVLYASNMQGGTAEYRIEHFETGDTLRMEIVSALSAIPQFILYPRMYKGESYNYDEKLVLEGFPQCPYNVDTYKGWFTQIATNFLAPALGAAVGAVIGSPITGALAGNAASIAMSDNTAKVSAFNRFQAPPPKPPETLKFGDAAAAAAVPPPISAQSMAIGGQVGSTLAQMHLSSTQPPHTSSGGGSILMFSNQTLTFYTCIKTVSREYAEKIDNFLHMYGYALNTMMVPPIKARPEFTYVKTRGVNIVGDIPQQAMTRIKQCFDSGIRFWANHAAIGNFELINAPEDD